MTNIYIVDNKKYLGGLDVDYGASLEIIGETDNAYLCYRAGYTGWYQVGLTQYYSPAFYVFSKSPLEELREFEYSRATKKETLAKALEFLKGVRGGR